MKVGNMCTSFWNKSFTLWYRTDCIFFNLLGYSFRSTMQLLLSRTRDSQLFASCVKNCSATKNLFTRVYFAVVSLYSIILIINRSPYIRHPSPIQTTAKFHQWNTSRRLKISVPQQAFSGSRKGATRPCNRCKRCRHISVKLNLPP